MKRVFVLAAVMFTLLISTATAIAQQTQRVNYRATTYYKVAPEKKRLPCWSKPGPLAAK